MTLNKQNNNTGLIAHQSLSVQLALTGHSFLITHTHTKEAALTDRVCGIAKLRRGIDLRVQEPVNTAGKVL